MTRMPGANEDPLNSSLQQLTWLLTKNASQIAENSTTARNTSRDEPKKPGLSYSHLIREAIENSPGGRCTLSGIYDAVARRYPYYSSCGSTTWKNSIRHNLSLNKTFIKLEKAPGETGKGSYWMVREAAEKEKRKKLCEERQQQMLLREKEQQVPHISEDMDEASSSSQVAGRELLEEFFQQELPGGSHYEVNESTGSGEFQSYSYYNETEKEEELHPSPLLSSAMMDEEEDLSLFDSQDLSASFRSVYDKVFKRRPPSSAQEQETRIDWLKISLEAAGMNCRDNEDMANVETSHFIDMLEERETRESTPSSSEFSPLPTYSTFSRERKRPKNTTTLNELHYPKKMRSSERSVLMNGGSNDEDEDDEFDWNTLVT